MTSITNLWRTTKDETNTGSATTHEVVPFFVLRLLDDDDDDDDGHEAESISRYSTNSKTTMKQPPTDELVELPATNSSTDDRNENDSIFNLPSTALTRTSDEEGGGCESITIKQGNERNRLYRTYFQRVKAVFTVPVDIAHIVIKYPILCRDSMFVLTIEVDSETEDSIMQAAYQANRTLIPIPSYNNYYSNNNNNYHHHKRTSSSSLVLSSSSSLSTTTTSNASLLSTWKRQQQQNQFHQQQAKRASINHSKNYSKNGTTFVSTIYYSPLPEDTALEISKRLAIRMENIDSFAVESIFGL